MTTGTTVNWGNLYAQGRCKAIGIPWTDEENKAVCIKKIPAEYVRLGILKHSDYVTRQAKDDAMKEQPLIKKDKEELLKIAHVAGINATSDASKETLVVAIENKFTMLKEQKEKEAKDKEAKAKIDEKIEASAKEAAKKTVEKETPKVEKSENKPNK